MTKAPVLAICVRIHIAALAVIENGTVVEIYRRYFQFTPKGLSREKHLAKLVRRIVRCHGIKDIVVEPDCVGERAAKLLPIEPKRLRLKDAKTHLLGGERPTTHAELYQYLVERDPRLTKYVRVLGGRVASNDDERFRTINLLAAGLGLGAAGR